MAFTKITAAGIGSTETVTLDGLSVINDASFNGNVSVGGTLTYEDVTNIDSVGLITARAGVVVGSGITLSKDGDVFFTGIATGNGSGLTALNASNISSGTVPTARLGSGTASSSTFLRGDSTFQTVNTDLVSDTSPQLGGDLDTNDFEILLDDSHSVKFGDGADCTINHSGADFAITNSTGNLNILNNSADAVQIRHGSETMIKAISDGAVELYHDDSKKIETTATGAVVTGILTATTFVSTESQLSQRNLIINGAMRVAQRATSYTGGYGTSNAGDYYKTVDRMFVSTANLPNTDVTTAQVSLTSGDPYDLGFRYAMQLQMGYQGSVPSNVGVNLQYRMEAQDVATSGWNYTSSSSFITLSFWVKSTVSQTFYGLLRTLDGTQYKYPFSYALTANTWKKVIVKVPGNSNLTINNDTGEGLRINLAPYLGTDNTASGVTLNTWSTHSNSAKTPDQTSTWYSTNGATFEVTGLQLEVGSMDTPFEHISYQQDFSRCERYFQYVRGGIVNAINSNGDRIPLPTTRVTMRATPTISNTTFTEFSAGTSRSISSFEQYNDEIAGYAQLSSTPSNGVYVTLTASAEL